MRSARCPEAREWIDRLFRWQLTSLDERQFAFVDRRARIRNAAIALRKSGAVRWRVRKALISLLGNVVERPDAGGFEPQTGYALFQEFLAGNAYDTRITVIGRRAFGFRRLNRENDFRASGSGKLDWDPERIDKRMVTLAFMAASALKTQSCAIDGLYRDGVPVIAEVSYTYTSVAVHECPGHWELDGDPSSGELRWVLGQMWPEQAQVADFIERLRRGQPDSRRSTANAVY